MLKEYNKITNEEIKHVNIVANYHTHNYLCGHARGTVTDYVNEAIRCGLKILGISDHCTSPEGTTEPYITQTSLLTEYLPQFDDAKKLFGDKIKILSAVEIDYFPNHDGYYKKLLENLDYLVLGQHEYFLNGERKLSFFDGLDEENVLAYCEHIVSGLKTNMFSLLAHPDLIFYHRPEITEKVANAFENLIKEAIKADVPLELNANGIRSHNFNYPTDFFIDLCKKYNAKVIVSSDCHSPELLCDENMLKLYCYAVKNKLNIVNEIILK